jgi:hypothetical protein
VQHALLSVHSPLENTPHKAGYAELGITGQSLPFLWRDEFSGFCEDLGEPVGDTIKQAARGVVGQTATIHFKSVLGGC